MNVSFDVLSRTVLCRVIDRVGLHTHNFSVVIVATGAINWGFLFRPQTLCYQPRLWVWFVRNRDRVRFVENLGFIPEVLTSLAIFLHMQLLITQENNHEILLIKVSLLNRKDPIRLETKSKSPSKNVNERSIVKEEKTTYIEQRGSRSSWTGEGVAQWCG